MLARSRTRFIGTIITLLGAAAIAVLTLRPAPTNAIEPRWACVVCGTTGVADVLINVLLYVPYGVGLTLAGMRPVRALALVAATTFAVELLQYRVLVGRDGTLSDVLTNTIGGGLGVLATLRWRTLVFPTTRSSAVFAAGCAMVWMLVLAASARALDLAADTAGALVWWRPVMPPFQQFQGVLDTVLVNGRSTANRDVLPSGPARADVVSMDVALRTSGSGAPSAPIVWVGHGDRHDAVLSRVRDDLVARFNVRGVDWRLVSPAFLLPDAFRMGAASLAPKRVGAEMAGHVVTLTASAPNVSRTRSVPVGPTLGWSLLMPSSIYVGPRYQWLSVAWMSAFLFPLGYWARRATRSRPDSSTGAGRLDVVPAAVAATSVLFAFAVLGAIATVMTGTRTAWWEWMGAAGALVGGAATAAVVGRA